MRGANVRRRVAVVAVVAAFLACSVGSPAFAKAKDSDGDGMPDRWEKAHGLNWRKADARADADGDGVTNIKEFHLGLDPQKAEGKCTDLQLALGAKPGECGQGGVPIYLN